MEEERNGSDDFDVEIDPRTDAGPLNGKIRPDYMVRTAADGLRVSVEMHLIVVFATQMRELGELFIFFAMHLLAHTTNTRWTA